MIIVRPLFLSADGFPEPTIPTLVLIPDLTLNSLVTQLSYSCVRENPDRQYRVKF
jgi:hypothetical protein